MHNALCICYAVSAATLPIMNSLRLIDAIDATAEVVLAPFLDACNGNL
jgi:hypothetical protein